MEENEEYYSTNNISGIVKVISIITAILGIILCIVFSEYLKIYTIAGIIDFIVLGVFIYGFGELIGIMHDIRTNTEHLRDYFEREKR